MKNSSNEKQPSLFTTVSRSLPLTIMAAISFFAVIIFISTLIGNNNRADKTFYEYRVALVPSPEPLKRPELGKMSIVNYIWAGQYRVDKNHPWVTAVYAPDEDSAMREIDTIMQNELKAKQTSDRIFKAKIVQVDAIRIEKTYTIN